MPHARSPRPRLPVLLALAGLFVLAPAPLVRAADVKEKEPGPKSRGELYAWKSADGLLYWYRVPKDYDAEKGANLTLILHGSNLDHQWGFANHSKDSFRPDDVVVSPDGTTPNGNGGFNFLGEKKDAKRVKALIDELKEKLNLRRTYLYGHSQGSFFALYFAGEYPEDVDGVVGHASGVWNWTQQGRKGHHQAIVLMHGTQDPVVPYMQSVGGYRSFVDQKYPMVRLRSLEGWNHWPAEHNGPVPNTSQELAWCEGMTTDDPARLEACLDFLRDNKSKEWHDYAGLYSLAAHVEGLETAGDDLQAKARAAREAVEALVQAHLDALDVPADGKFDGKAWVGHLPVFLRAFQGVPACDALRGKLEKLLDAQQKDAVKHLRKYWDALRKDDARDAFLEGTDALEAGFLYAECWDKQLRENLAKWRKDAKETGLKRNDSKAYDAFIGKFEDALKDGFRAFERINAKAGRL